MKVRVLALVAFLTAIAGSFSAGFFLNRVEIVDKKIFINNTEYVDVPGEIDPVFYEVMEKLMTDHYTAPEIDALWEGAIYGMIESLDDPYTVYWDYEEAASFQQSMGESYVGIGVSVKFLNEMIVVEEVKPGSPAEQGGILVNDIIVSVDGESTLGEGFYDTIGKIVGEAGTDVLVGVRRQGFETEIPLLLTRAVIDNPTVEYEVIVEPKSRIGYIKVYKFGTETYSKFAIALSYLESQNIDGLVVDLRNNGGGQVTTVRNMLDLFLYDNNKPMFITEGSYNGNFERIEYNATGTDVKSYEIITLVNQNSASASEVFASAMQEHGGYTVVGTTTFGKGTMQITPLLSTTEGDRLHITIGKWKTTNENWVHGVGITPDTIVEQTKYETAYKVFLGDDILLEDTVDPRTKNVQYILNIMGYSVREDGYFDSITKAAITDIQTTHNLPVTGAINSETMTVINQALSDFLSNKDNDTQLQTAVSLLLGE